MLNSNELVHYLLEQNLVSFSSLMEGGLKVAASRSRNQNFRVMRSEGQSFFVKHALPNDAQTHFTLAREAGWYQAVSQAALFSKLQEYLPVYVGYDPEYPLLIVELIPDGINVREYHNLVQSFPVEIAELMAKGLGACHAINESEIPAQDASLFQFQLPWILTVDLHAQAFSNALSPANNELISIIRSDEEFDELLTGLRNQWQRSALIHGDVKWDNCVLHPFRNSAQPSAIKLVDWESFGIGDPGWDVGSIFHAYLAYWVWSMPFTENSSPAEAIENARFPIEVMQPAIQAFWQAYLAELQLSSSEASDLLLRSIMFSGARLLQTTYESMVRSDYLSAPAIYMIQLGQNLLISPEDAIEILLGIS